MRQPSEDEEKCQKDPSSEEMQNRVLVFQSLPKQISIQTLCGSQYLEHPEPIAMPLYERYFPYECIVAKAPNFEFEQSF